MTLVEVDTRVWINYWGDKLMITFQCYIQSMIGIQFLVIMAFFIKMVWMFIMMAKRVEIIVIIAIILMVAILIQLLCPFLTCNLQQYWSRFLKHANGDVLNLAAFKEGSELVIMLLDISEILAYLVWCALGCARNNCFTSSQGVQSNWVCIAKIILHHV